MIAETAIVSGDSFIHYCHQAKQFVHWRSYRETCPICGCKNPRFQKGTKVAYLVTDYSNKPIIAFYDHDKAIEYIRKYDNSNMMLGDVGIVQ